MNTTQRGRWGETLAVIYLEKKNTQVVARNWRWKRYEIDLVGRKNQTWVFVEVKVRRWGYLESAIAAVNDQKQQESYAPLILFCVIMRLMRCTFVSTSYASNMPEMLDASNTLRMHSFACHDSVS